MPLLSIEDVFDWRGKIVLVRADLNVPIENGVIKDDFKIVSSLPTIRYLTAHKATVILVSHLGRPAGRPDTALSLLPIARHLEKKLHRTVLFIDQGKLPAKQRWKLVKEAAEKMPLGGIILLENIRFFPGEDDASSPLARGLARCADVFVLEGFGVSHRAAASVSGVAAYLPSFAGLLLKKEVTALEKIMTKPRRPLVLVLGGAKVESKIPLLKAFVKRADTILLGGAIMSVYLAAHGFKVGGMKVDKKSARELLAVLKRGNVVMAVDAVVGGAEGENARVVDFDRSFSLDNPEEFLFDVGPKTLALFKKVITKAKTIVWNGALGKFECKKYRTGTVTLVRLLAERGRQGAEVIAGGGETAEIIRSERVASSYTLVSTGGGAMLDFLSSTEKKLPGIAALEASAKK